MLLFGSRIIAFAVLPGSSSCTTSIRSYTEVAANFICCSIGAKNFPSCFFKYGLLMVPFDNTPSWLVGSVSCHGFIQRRALMSSSCFPNGASLWVQHYMEKFPGKSLQLSIGQLISVAGLTGLWCAYSTGGHLPDVRWVISTSFSL